MPALPCIAESAWKSLPQSALPSQVDNDGRLQQLHSAINTHRGVGWGTIGDGVQVEGRLCGLETETHNTPRQGSMDAGTGLCKRPKRPHGQNVSFLIASGVRQEVGYGDMWTDGGRGTPSTETGK